MCACSHLLVLAHSRDVTPCAIRGVSGPPCCVLPVPPDLYESRKTQDEFAAGSHRKAAAAAAAGRFKDEIVPVATTVKDPKSGAEQQVRGGAGAVWGDAPGATCRQCCPVPAAADFVVLSLFILPYTLQQIQLTHTPEQTHAHVCTQQHTHAHAHSSPFVSCPQRPSTHHLHCSSSPHCRWW